MEMTSAYANKLLKKLNEDKEYYLAREMEGSTYVSAADEEPLIPDYDYDTVASKITEIDETVMKIKHAINVANANSTILVDDTIYSADQILIRMAQLNARKLTLDGMRKRSAKMRLGSVGGLKNTQVEYLYVNYDIASVAEDYARIDAEISLMQLALDKYNQTVTFEVPDLDI